jgi:hypothetical protein
MNRIISDFSIKMKKIFKRKGKREGEKADSSSG